MEVLTIAGSMAGTIALQYLVNRFSNSNQNKLIELQMADLIDREFKSKDYSTLEIKSSSEPELMDALLDFVNTLTVKDKLFHYSGSTYKIPPGELNAGSTICKAVAGFGLQTFIFEEKEIKIFRKSDVSASGYYYTLLLVVKKNDSDKLVTLLQRAWQAKQDSFRGKVVVYGLVEPANAKLQWERFSIKRARSAETLALPLAKKQKLFGDVKNFLDPSTRNWCQQKGIPYRRGLLLYGPPGCGKSSIVHVLASEFGMNIYVITLSARQLEDTLLMSLVNAVPAGSLVLIEDVDAAFKGRTAYEAGIGVTMGGLLNTLDSINAQEGSVVVMTTNHPERLDGAMKRAGRCDLRVKIEYPMQEEAEILVTNLLCYSPADAATFGAELVAQQDRIKRGQPPSYNLDERQQLNNSTAAITALSTAINDSVVRLAAAPPNQRAPLQAEIEQLQAEKARLEADHTAMKDRFQQNAQNRYVLLSTSEVQNLLLQNQDVANVQALCAALRDYADDFLQSLINGAV